jgi:hypothetical protein
MSKVKEKIKIYKEMTDKLNKINRIRVWQRKNVLEIWEDLENLQKLIIVKILKCRYISIIVNVV